MNTSLILISGFTQWLEQMACRLREARRMRRELDELSRMGAHELADLGISHAALAAAARREPCCA
jgi:uncharacterized protein YjiS (DUF1127 family)